MSLFPAVGHIYEVNYGTIVVHLNFISDKEVILTAIEGPLKGSVETVQITVMPIRSGVFMVYWQEENHTTVVHVEDFEQNIIYANITLADHTFLNLQGTLKRIQ